MKYLVLVAFLLSGCAAFTEKVEWSDEAYGGKLHRVAYESYNATHEPLGMKPRTRIGNKSLLVHNREATTSCVTHTIMVASKLDNYEVILLKKTEGLWHSVVKVGDQVIDIKNGEPYPYSDYQGQYMEEKNLGQVKPEKIAVVLNTLGYTFSK